MRKFDLFLLIAVIVVMIGLAVYSVAKDHLEYERSEIAKLAKERICECSCRVRCMRWVSPEQNELLSSLCEK